MMETLELKIINELSQYSFFVPSYQRGYRWTKQEVTALLDDIDDFTPRQVQNSQNPDDKTWYCLQPIVIKCKKGNEYEVIDGQQRLTTIFLILHYLNQYYTAQGQAKLFKLDYETREKTAEFLENLDTQNNEDSIKNIDFHYIKNAYKAIEDWFNKKGLSFDKYSYDSKFRFSTKIIWYENSEDNPIAVFTRLNIGKINLTNAELIKALFLNSSNFGNGLTNETLRKKQLEISTEWDNIENTLQDDKFWYFISNDEKMTNNRIELIFDIISEKKSEENDSYFTFYHFNNKFKNKTEEVIDEIWREVKNCFQRLHEWYSEPSLKLYHIIGYLINIGKVTIPSLLKESSSRKKSEFTSYLNEKIKDSIKSIEIDELSYDDKEKVKNVLLLYNIVTMMKNKSDSSRFPFDIYKKESWDIEHITAISEKMPKEKEMSQWLEDVLPYIDDQKEDAKELRNNIKSFDESNENNENNENFEEIFKKVIEHFGENIDEDINHISNLALLDSKTNRGYKNSVFPVKRKTIIDRDKSGVFIPICTKNVFLKYFTEYPPKISFWTREDREKYKEDLKNVLNIILEEEDGEC